MSALTPEDTKGKLPVQAELRPQSGKQQVPETARLTVYVEPPRSYIATKEASILKVSPRSKANALSEDYT